MEDFWGQVFWHNTLKQWVTALGILTACIIAVRIFKSIIIITLKKFSKKTKTAWDDFIISQIERSVVPMAYAAGVYIAVASLDLPALADKIINIAVLVVVTYYVLRVLTSTIREFVFSFLKKSDDSETKSKQARGLIIVINAVIWILGVVFLIDNFGYDVTAIVAGLGIGGIAIALAAQAILGDLFSYFVIFFDRPFEIGDFIIVDDKMGEVAYVGVKTTRIKTLGGEELVFSNTDLTNSRVHNYKRMERRRVVFKIGVVYHTSHEKLKAIPGLVKNIIETKEHVQFDRGHFSGFGASSLDFEFVFYVTGADYNFYMDKQQAIFLDTIELFEKEGIKFAYPTQTLFIQSNQASVQGAQTV